MKKMLFVYVSILLVAGLTSCYNSAYRQQSFRREEEEKGKKMEIESEIRSQKQAEKIMEDFNERVDEKNEGTDD